MTTLAYQKAVNATCLVGVAGMLTMPDVILGVLLELAHLMFELVHFLFEVFESALDHLVEHLLHTEPKETQIIVFYLILAMGLGAAYYLSKAALRFFQALKISLQTAFRHYTALFSHFWAASAINKFQVIAWFHVVLTLVVLFGF